MKTIYFLCGLPRCGNTLLASILNQNSNITVTQKSIGTDILHSLEQLKEQEHFINFPDHEPLDNLIKESLQIYYKNFKSNYIIDRSTWGTPGNVKLIKKYITPNPKFIVLERPYLEILASFSRIKKWKEENIDQECYLEMTQGMSAHYSYAVDNILKNNYDHIKITYNELTAEPKKCIEKIYKFLNIPEYDHRYVDLDQLVINKVEYDDSVLDGVHHEVRKNKIEKKNPDIEKYLTTSAIEKYKNIKVLF